MQLMISVLDAAEARAALRGGAEILDVKNPGEGALGAQPPGVIREIRSIASGGVPLSAALGDMPHLPGTAALAALGAAACGADYVKVGLRGARTGQEALELLRAVREAVRHRPTRVIAALYADGDRAGTIPPESLPRLAAQARVHGCLIDTAVKDGRGLFDFMNPASLRRLADEAHAAGLLFALAGALGEDDLPSLREIGADIAGFRSAACRAGRRGGPLDEARVRRICSVILLKKSSP